MEADVRLHLEPFEEDARGPHRKVRGNEAAELWLGHAHRGPRNCTSRSSAMKRWPESIEMTWPVTALAAMR